MTLHNYWWLIIWPLLFGGASAVLIPKCEEYVLGKKETRWHWIPALILVLPFVIWAAWRINSIGDTALYRYQFLSAPASLSRIIAYAGAQSKDKGFAVFIVLFKALISSSDIMFFFVVAALQMMCLVVMYRKYSPNFWLSIFMFVASTDYVSWFMNGMRQFISAAVILICLPLIIKKRYLLVSVIVLLLSTIHLSTLIFLPFVFIINGKAWNIRTVLFIFTVILSAFFIDRITGWITNAIADTAYYGNIQYFLNDDGANILRVMFYSIPAILSLVFKRYIDAADDPMISICVNLSIITAGFYVFSYFTSGILIGRLPIFFSLANYVLIPWLIKEVFKKKTALITTGVFIVTYIVFFYFQMHVAWHLI